MTSVGTAIGAGRRTAAHPPWPARRRLAASPRDRCRGASRDLRAPGPARATAGEHGVALPLVNEALDAVGLDPARRAPRPRHAAARSASVGRPADGLSRTRRSTTPGWRPRAGARPAPRASSRRRAPGQRRALRAAPPARQRSPRRTSPRAAGRAAVAGQHGTRIRWRATRSSPSASHASLVPVNPWSSRTGCPAPSSRTAQRIGGVTVIDVTSRRRHGERALDGGGRLAVERHVRAGRCAARGRARRAGRSTPGSPARGRRASRAGARRRGGDDWRDIDPVRRPEQLLVVLGRPEPAGTPGWAWAGTRRCRRRRCSTSTIVADRPQLRDDQRVQVVEERDIADDERDGAVGGRRGAERRGDDAVDAVRTAVGADDDRPVGRGSQPWRSRTASSCPPTGRPRPATRQQGRGTARPRTARRAPRATRTSPATAAARASVQSRGPRRRSGRRPGAPVCVPGRRGLRRRGRTSRATSAG